MTGRWTLYVVRAGDGTLYTGVTTDLDRRVAEHRAGGARAARYLRGRGPVRVELAVDLGSRARAFAAERALKRLARRQKEELIAAAPDPARLLELLELGPARP